MAKVFLKVLLSFIATFVNTILAPVDLVVSVLFPNLSVWENYFTSTYAQIESLVDPYVGYFLSLIGPSTSNVIALWFDVALIYYTTTITLHLIFKIFKIIQNIKIW